MTKVKALAIFVAVIGTLLYLKTIFYPKAATWENLNKAGLAAYAKGDYTEAEKQLKAALKVAENFSDEDSRLTLILNNLAEIYQIQNKYAEAEPIIKRSLAIAEKTFGPSHPNVAANLNNLANNYRIRGMYAEAEPLYKRVLDIWEKTLEQDNPLVLFALENYANILQKVGRDTEARSYDARIKASHEKFARENPAN